MWTNIVKGKLNNITTMNIFVIVWISTGIFRSFISVLLSVPITCSKLFELISFSFLFINL